jgi:hypothetical protein
MKSLLFFSAWQSRGISKRNIQYIAYIPPHVNVFHSHFVTCCIVPTFGFFHISPLLHRVEHCLQRGGKECNATIGRGKRNEIKRAHPPTLLTWGDAVIYKILKWSPTICWIRWIHTTSINWNNTWDMHTCTTYEVSRLFVSVPFF